MKYPTILLIVLMGIIMASTLFLGSGHIAQAQGASVFAPGTQYQYNLMYRFRGADYRIRTQADLYAFLQELIEYLEDLRENIETDGVEVTTRSATDVTDDSALLRGEVIDFNRSDYANVWFQYGRSSSDLSERTSSERLDDSDDGNFEHETGNLREDTHYYFRAAARDERGRDDYGSILQFTTDNIDETEGDPEVSTRSAIDITDTSATLRGSVDMNDFRNGIAFFVYGEDSDEIKDVADNYDSYGDIVEDGDSLQKVRADDDLEGSESYEVRVTLLDDDTGHYFSMCVQFEDEDGDDVITCGSAKSFHTDS